MKIKKIIASLLLGISLINTVTIPAKADTVALNNYTYNGNFLLWDNKKEEIVILPQVKDFSEKIKKEINIDYIDIKPFIDIYLDCLTKERIVYPYINYSLDLKQDGNIKYTIMFTFTRDKQLYNVIILKNNKKINNDKAKIKQITKDKETNKIFNIINSVFNANIKSAYSKNKTNWYKIKQYPLMGYAVMNKSLNKEIKDFDIYQHFYTEDIYNEFLKESAIKYDIFSDFSKFNKFTKTSTIRLTNQNNNEIQFLFNNDNTFPLVFKNNRLSLNINNDITNERFIYGINYLKTEEPFIYYSKYFNTDNSNNINYIFNDKVKDIIDKTILENKDITFDIPLNNITLTVEYNNKYLKIYTKSYYNKAIRVNE